MPCNCVACAHVHLWLCSLPCTFVGRYKCFSLLVTISDHPDLEWELYNREGFTLVIGT
jgi:hypothetical protein